MLLDRRHFISNALLGIAGTVSFPAMARDQKIPSKDIVQKTLDDAKAWAQFCRDQDQTSALWRDNDWRIIYTTAAFIPVVYFAHMRGRKVTLELLAQSVDSLKVAMDNCTSPGLPKALQQAAVDGLSAIPFYDRFSYKQHQVAHDQFGYNTMHVIKKFHESEGWL